MAEHLVIAQHSSGVFIYLNGDERIDLKDPTLPGAIREIIAMGKPVPKKWWNKNGFELEIPKAILPR